MRTKQHNQGMRTRKFARQISDPFYPFIRQKLRLHDIPNKKVVFLIFSLTFDKHLPIVARVRKGKCFRGI